jgi:hypothetical protein
VLTPIDYYRIVTTIMEEFTHSPLCRDRGAKVRPDGVKCARELLALFRAGFVGDITPARKKRSRARSRRAGVTDSAAGDMMNRRRAHLIKMDRLWHKRLDELDRQGNVPNSAEFNVALREMRMAEAAALATENAACWREPEPESDETWTGEAAASRLDAPYDQGTIDTPDQGLEVKIAAITQSLYGPRTSVIHAEDPAITPALPRQPSEYPRRWAPAETNDD